MTEIDDISMEIGQLKAQVAEGNRQREAQFRKLDGIVDKLNEISGQVKLVADQVSTIKKEMEDDIKPAVSEWKTMKAKGVGALAVIGVLSSGIGAGLFKFFGQP